MKKVNIYLIVLFLTITFTGFTQTATKEFFIGKWKIFVTSSPRGNVKFVTDPIRKEGKLTGELLDQTDLCNGPRKITKVEENGVKVAIYFESSQGGEISINLAKVDENNFRGSLMSFETVVKRLKN